MTVPTSVIWDFNGTILDDVELAAGAANEMLKRRGLPELTPRRHRELICFPIADYYRVMGFDLEEEAHQDLADEFHDLYLAGVENCGMNEGVGALLEAFRRSEARQFVLSAAEESMLKSWVDMLGVSHYFEGVYGLTDRLASGKADRGRSLVADFALDPTSTLFIGDTDHDVEVARAIGCRPVAVLQGHQTRQRIDGAHCTVVETFDDLMSQLQFD